MSEAVGRSVDQAQFDMAWRSQPLGLFESEVPGVRQRLPSARFLCGPEDRGRCCKATSFISSSGALRLGEEGHAHRPGAGAHVRGASFKDKSLAAVVQEKDKEAEEEELEEEAAAKQAPDPDKVNPECTQARKTGRPRCCLCINGEAIWSQDGSCKHCVDSGKGIRDCSEVDEGCRPGSISWPLKYKEQEVEGHGQGGQGEGEGDATQAETGTQAEAGSQAGLHGGPNGGQGGLHGGEGGLHGGEGGVHGGEGGVHGREGAQKEKEWNEEDDNRGAICAESCAERFVTNITGEMNIPRARTPHEAKMLTKQAEQEAAQQAEAKEEIAKEQEEISKEMEKHGDEIAAETPA
ncbi:unnamed protein product [Symbiodinium sp. CCMP2456]|nr:unnamed protein product [Symbiodinium sp. CCMP2456]